MTGRRAMAIGRRVRAAGWLLCLALLPAAAGAQAGPETGMPAARDLPETTLRQIAASPERFLDGILARMRKISPDGDVTPEEITLAEQRRRAGERADQLRRLLAHDLDGDGTVTRAEFDAGATAVRKPADGWFDKLAARADTDGDGALSPGELYAHADWLADRRFGFVRPQYNPYDLAQFDGDGDGTVTEAEVTEAVHAIARELALLRRAPAQGAPAGCAPPPPPAGAEVVLLSGYEGGGISTVATNGMDVETTAATIIIEEGARPLYIFATAAAPIIWKLDGAVGRVARLVVQPPQATLGPGAGVVGPPPEVIEFVAPNSCIKYFSEPDDGNARRAAGEMAARLGRDPAELTVIGHYELHEVRVPSGKATRTRSGSYLGITFTAPKKQAAEPERAARTVPVPAEAGGAKPGEPPRRLPNSRRAPVAQEPAAAEAPPDPNAAEIAELTKALLQYHPGGVIEIDADEVVAPGVVRPYDVLPMQAGIIQLLESGALQKTSDGTYVVLREIPRLPASWTIHTSPHRKFVFGKGVPRPDRGPGRAPPRAGN